METINLRNVIAEKNPSLARRMPGFMLNLIGRILYLKEINLHITTHGHKDGVANSNSFLEDLNISYTVHGVDKIKAGRYQFASNHPLGGLDGVCLISVINKYFGEPRFMVNDVLMHLKFFKDIFVPINTFGLTSKNNAKIIDNAYSLDNPIIIFPAGIVSRRVKGKIVDLAWRKSFVQKSIEHQRDIVPVFFEGVNTKRFYRVANIRKWLGVKTNIEMFLLPSQMYKKRNAHFNIYFGEPIPWQTLETGKSVRDWSSTIKEIVYQLRP
ncbi:MAG: glycerol acyltransferase [Salinivirgaceae bacterium]|nr:glycerol acyltransferase [Salinivirgaceae bacterium]